jgi:hypothetical protein
VTYDPAMDGPAAGPRRHDEASQPAWPVLARLPWVGEEEHAEPALTYDQRYAAPPQQQDLASAALRIADEPHAGAARRQFRIDPGVSRKSAPPPSAMRLVAQRDKAESFAGHIYQWHAALAPYAGVAVTFVLALFAGLLYWSMFGHPNDPAADMTAAPQWEAESNAPVANAAPTWAAQPSFDLPQSPLSHTPNIRLDLPDLGGAGKTAASPDANIHADAEPPVAAPIGDAQPLEVPAAAPVQPNEPAVAAAPSTETAAASPSAPTAAPLRITYPTTPFASFDFGPSATQIPSTGPAATPAATR